MISRDKLCLSSSERRTACKLVALSAAKWYTRGVQDLSLAVTFVTATAQHSVAIIARLCAAAKQHRYELDKC